jgi:hypothetical protein
MPRKTQRKSTASAATPQHKRAASGSLPSSIATSRSKRQKATPTKSPYFEGSDSDDIDMNDGDNASDEVASQDDAASEFGATDEPSPSEESGDEYDSASDDAPARKKTTTATKPTTSTTNTKTQGNELWRPGVKAGLGPGTQVVIKKPKARSPGKIPYQDDTIHPNTMLFLEELKANNDRQWLKSK